MAGFNRKDIKATTSEALSTQEQEQDDKRPSRRGGDGLTYHELADGDNYFRVYPFHPNGGGKSFTEAKTVSFLPIERLKRDPETGKEIEGEYEIVNKPVFNSKVHGNTDKDLVEEYMKYAKEVVLPEKYGDDEAGYKKDWNKIIGYKDAKGKFHPGVKPQDSWVMLGDMKIKNAWEFGQLEVKKSVKSKMLDAASELNTPDPFTDPDNGIVAIIKKDATAGAKDPNKYYSVKLESEKITGANGRPTIEFIETPLSDEQLGKWFETTPLYKKFRGAFTNKDFVLQLEGLERFDKEQGIGVFEYDDFMQIVEEIQAQVAEDPAEEKKEEAKSTSGKATGSSSAKSAAAKVVFAPEPTPPPATKRRATAPPVVEEQLEDEPPLIDEDEDNQNAEQIKASKKETSSASSTKSRMEQIKRNTKR